MYDQNVKDDVNLKLNKLVLNNGAILKASVGNIDCFDISKHITGTLRQNLIELGCTVQKGDFDYSLGDDWDKMSRHDQSSCINYLEGDVLGLKELSERLNKSCFENFEVNLYKFMSTSQLTYAKWVDFIYKESNNTIYLQTPDQEKFFRESIYGGRTYKYKNNFASSQRDAYNNGELSFEDIDDYLIDADVNSLYPAAMKEEFPIGGISDDLGENCKILYGGWIAPKLYFLEYVEKIGELTEIKYHLRGKGVPKDHLTVEMFETMMTGKSMKIEMPRDFKRINVTRNSMQTDVDNFSILKLDALVKHINTVPWKGRHFFEKGSVPLYHSSLQ